MKRRWRWLLALVACLLLLGSGLLRLLERVPYTESRPPSAEAQRNPFLAAQRMLQQLDVEVVELRAIGSELAGDAGTVLVWPYNRGVLPGRTIDAAEHFVAGGGHLIVEAGWWHEDALLERFGIARHDAEDFEDEDFDDQDFDDEDFEGAGFEGEHAADDEAWVDDADAPEYASDDCACGPGHHPNDGHHRSGTLLGAPEIGFYLHSHDWLSSRSEPIGEIADAGRARLLHLQHGRGRVTAIVGLEPFNNQQLGMHDHAELLARLVNLGAPAQRVLFMRATPAGFFDWLREYAWRVLAIGALFLLLVLWSAYPRFGPVAPDPAPQRRRLLDHLLASGRMLWNHGQHDVLAGCAAGAALDRVRAEYPHTRWLPRDQLAAFLQRRFRLDASVAGLLLAPSQVRHPASLITLARACQSIHHELSPRRSTRGSGPLYDS